MAGKSLEVSINPEVIKWARENAGFSIEEISKKLKTSKENFEKIESGKKHPTFRQLEFLANCFKRPVAIFFLPEPPEEPSIVSSFRILPKSEREFSKDLRLAIRKARYYQSISNDLMKDLGIDSKPKITVATLQNNPQEFAKEERKRMGISLDEQLKWENAYEAFNAWRSAIESRNILVFQFKFPIEDARGFSLMDKEPPVIAINSADNILARIFTLFHEFAHIILGITEIYAGEEEVITDMNVENWCNSFASEFLIPQEVVEKDKDFRFFIQYRKHSPEILQNLSKKFKVSKKAILTRLRTLDLIEYDAYRRESSTLMEQDVKILKGFMTPPQKCLQEKGKQFISIILASKERGIITTQDVIEYLSIRLKHLNKIQELIAR
jgi:Zn-dependent peptidase ImmA (M78 family)/transcriptional regulator with XRE-family HTH domain